MRGGGLRVGVRDTCVEEVGGGELGLSIGRGREPHLLNFSDISFIAPCLLFKASWKQRSVLKLLGRHFGDFLACRRGRSKGKKRSDHHTVYVFFFPLAQIVLCQVTAELISVSVGPGRATASALRPFPAGVSCILHLLFDGLPRPSGMLGSVFVSTEAASRQRRKVAAIRIR